MKRIFFILLFVVAGCTPVTQYTHKANIPFNKTNFHTAPAIGISMYNNKIVGLRNVIMEDIARFAEIPVNFQELSKDMTLTSDRLHIEDMTEMRNKYPEIEYVISTFEFTPEKKKFTSARRQFQAATSAAGCRSILENPNIELDISMHIS